MKYVDVVIIGGGIVGAGVFRDLALQGVSVLLLDKGDFASQTSQGSSKMLHGGIRYLENFDFALVQEALEEKNIWLKLAPHLCTEQEFHLPVYAGTKWPLPFVRIGLFIYDALSHFQNQPSGRVSKSQVLKRFPDLKPEGLTGAGSYFDGIVDDHKLALECLWDGELEADATALNHQEVIEVKPGEPNLVTYRDRFTQKVTSVSAKFIVYATGPFTDEFMKQMKLPWEPALLPSKGIHLWLKADALKLYGPMVLPSSDGRVVFVIPSRGAILVGTTETAVTEKMFDIKAQDDEIRYLLGVIQDYFPNSKLSENHIISTFAAVRPLVKAAGHDRGSTSRTHRIFRPTPHSYVLIGGKYTTFRRMAQDLCKELVPRLGVTYAPNLTLEALRRPSVVGKISEDGLSSQTIERIIHTEKPRNWEDLVHRRLSIIQDPDSMKSVGGVDRADAEKMMKTP